jgi:hypothetical protein
MSGIYTHVKPDQEDIRLGRAHEKRVISSLPLQGNRRALARQKDAMPRRLTMGSALGRLQGMLAACSSICAPANLAGAKEFLEGAIGSLATREDNADLREMVAAAHAGSGVDRDLARANLGRIISENVGHLIRAGGTWVQWYESRSLAGDETAFMRNFVPQQVNVRVGNADGTLTTRHAQPNIESNEMVELFFLLSDAFVGTIYDPNKGNIADAQLGTVDIAMDLMEKIDSLLQVPFTVGGAGSMFIAAFINDGSVASHYHATSRIQTDNFPAGNIIAPTSNGAGTVPRYDCIRAIDEYFGRWGGGIGDGPMVPTTVHVASGIAHQFGNEATVGSAQNPWTDALFANRSVLSYNGRQYVIVPDATIDPTDKHLYVKSNLPGGIFFEKPDGAYVHREDRQRENEFETWERALIGTAFPLTWAPRVLAVKFKN